MITFYIADDYMNKDKHYYETKASEDEFLEWYKQQDLPSYPKPSVTVDMIVLRYHEETKKLQVLLQQRKTNPWKNKWALIGGFLTPEEDIIDAGIRITKQKTDIQLSRKQVKQLPAWSNPNRDPRGWTITNPLVAQVSDTNYKSSEYSWVNLEVVNSLDLAADHKDIIKYALDTLKSRLKTERLDAISNLLGIFTITKLEAIITQLTGNKPTRNNLKRDYKDQLISVKNTQYKGIGRPEKYYHIK